MSERSDLAHSMRAEAARLEKYADGYDEAATRAREKAAALRQKAAAHDAVAAKGPSHPRTHPWRKPTGGFKSA